MRPLVELAMIVVGYFFGCMNGAYITGRYRYGQDIRELGSFNAGARNAGRVFGKVAFVSALILDIAKTIVPLFLATSFTKSEWLIGFVAIAVLIGHIWPAPMQFRGGKGVVVYLASALIMEPWTLLGAGGVLLIGLGLKSSFTIAGLVALVTIPIVLAFSGDVASTVIFTVMMMILLFTHLRGKGYE